MSLTRKQNNRKEVLARCGGTGILSLALLGKTVLQLQHRTTYDPATALLRNAQGNWRYMSRQRHVRECSKQHYSERPKHPKCSAADKWINKRWYIHVMEYYSAVIRHEARSVTWMNSKTLWYAKKPDTEDHTELFHFDLFFNLWWDWVLISQQHT